MMELKEKIKAEFLPENENKEKGRSNLWCNEHICAYCGKVFIGTSQWVYRTRRKWACCYTHMLRLEEQAKQKKSLKNESNEI